MLNEDYFEGLHVSSVRSGGELQSGVAIANNSTVIIYTVAANYELLLSRYFLTGYSASTVIGSLLIYNTVPALVHTIDKIYIIANNHQHAGGNIIPPLVLPTGYTIRVFSNLAGGWIEAGFLGYRYPTP